MHAASYKHFLNAFDKAPRFFSIQKIFLVVLGAIVIVTGLTSAVVYFQYIKETPIRNQKTYLDTTIIQFNSTKSATNELIKSFQVAGTRTEFFKPQEESSSTKDAYFVANDDLDRLIAQTKLALEVIKSAEKSRYSNSVPPEFAQLDQEIKHNHSRLLSYLEDLKRNYQSSKEIAMALGPDLYFPTSTSTNLWEKKDKDEISAYYTQKLEKSDDALAKLSRISPPEDFQNYYKLEIAYLEILVNLAKDINNTLAQKDTINEDAATQLEISYALAVKAEKDMRVLIQDILHERASLFDLGKNLNDLSQIKIAQNSIESDLSLYANHYSEIRLISFPKLPDSSALQIPTNIW